MLLDQKQLKQERRSLVRGEVEVQGVVGGVSGGRNIRLVRLEKSQ